MMIEREQDSKDKAERAAGHVVRSNRAQMIAIMMIGFVVLGASYAAFYIAKTGGVWGTTNHGEFVTPHTTIDQLGWQVEGEKRRWWLWMVTQGCGSSCQDQVRNLEALHTLLNREVHRVRRGYTGPTNTPRPGWLEKHPSLAWVTVTERADVADGIYIVDPHGNLVLFYVLEAEPKLILEDLKKLLKVSQIG